jgi:MSHA pilin protein MshD
LDTRPTKGSEARPGNYLTAFTIVEAMISTIIVGVMFVAALNTVGASRLTQHKASLVCRSQLLAESLMSEILRQSYKDPDGTPIFGRESNESATPRTTWDDVDDYEGLSESPPVTKDGAALTNATGWQRTVKVEWVDAANPAQVQTVETGVKRVVVTVAYKNVPQASLATLKTDHP